MPWGDYGDLLLSGILSLDENGEKTINRAGPVLPPMCISGIWDIILSNQAKGLLEKSNLTGFKLSPINKGKIVSIPWHTWSLESDEPAFYPLSGAPEDYIFDEAHSDTANRAMGEVWTMELVKSGHFSDEKLLLSEYYDFFMPENRGIIIVTQTAKTWLENNSIANWITFENLSFMDID